MINSEKIFKLDYTVPCITPFLLMYYTGQQLDLIRRDIIYALGIKNMHHLFLPEIQKRKADWLILHEFDPRLIRMARLHIEHRLGYVPFVHLARLLAIWCDMQGPFPTWCYQ